ncbi:hypothetical protein TSAR_015126 [Trichomalopsis sarcophagae]|uniref:Uncharacterized protein n=1 Tax=Trichomalopsis sarcophagae TaxID=543379 RepID=A0A232EKZ4_9HYME|nr:hypothetical protein TSAR_015126 [Trichomalopsis sarcophagae]
MMSELKTTFPQAGKATEPNPADDSDGEDHKILKGIITGTIEYAEGRSNVYGPIKTGLANALNELVKTEEKCMSFLKVPVLRLGGESLGSRTTSMESLASITSARSMDSTSLMAQIANYRKALQEAIEVRKEEEDYITKLEKKPPAKAGPSKNRSPEVILVKVGQNTTYAEVTRKIRKDVNPDTTGIKVLGVKQTRSGDILLKLGRESDRTAFTGKRKNGMPT